MELLMKDAYKIFKELEERNKRANPYKFYDKDELIDEILKDEDEIERLNNIINELEKDFERKIQSCTIEAETTTNDFYCRLHIATLTKWLNKIKELKGSDKE